MNRTRSGVLWVPITLFLLTGLTIAFAFVQAFQILLGTLPPDSARLSTAPVSHFTHVLAGVLFGVTGPLQFGRVLANKFGRLHRVLGRVFILAGAFLSLSSLSLLWQFPTGDSMANSVARLVFGLALGFTLCKAVLAIRRRNISVHRDWMIRSYALGMGATLVAVVFLPIYLITGVPPTGLVSDIAFVGSWCFCVLVAEVVVRKLNRQTT